MAILGIDHVVVIGDDLDALVDQFRSLGFRVTPGGTHPGAMTHNALVPFQDGSYIELIAFHSEERRGRRAELLARGGGMIEYMLTSNAIELDLAQARQRRLPYGKPVPGSRVRPDGVEVAWLDGPVTDIGSSLPLLIQDVTSRSSRVPSGEARRHPNGAEGIGSLIIGVASIDNATLFYQRLLDSDADTARLTSEFVEATFLAGYHRLILRQPLDFGPLQDRIRILGDGPYALELLGPEPRTFDPADTGGTNIAIV
ncbi:MAG: VOC family protein [Thermomicrobiales bacterium]